MHTYWTGNQVQISGTFAVGGTVTDPTTITLQVKDPSGTTTAYTYAAAQVTRAGTGIYNYVLSVGTLSGNYTYKYAGTGACVASSEGAFFVDPVTV